MYGSENYLLLSQLKDVLTTQSINAVSVNSSIIKSINAVSVNSSIIIDDQEEILEEDDDEFIRQE